MRPTRYVLLSLTLMGFWLILSGHYTPLILFFGVFSCAVVTVVAWRMDRVDRYPFPLGLTWKIPGYLLWLLREIFKANLNVARIILDPRLPISPIMVPFRARMKSDHWRRVYAHSITLTPGTVSIRVHGTKITVHAIADEVADELLEGEMDRRVTRLEGEME